MSVHSHTWMRNPKSWSGRASAASAPAAAAPHLGQRGDRGLARTVPQDGHQPGGQHLAAQGCGVWGCKWWGRGKSTAVEGATKQDTRFQFNSGHAASPQTACFWLA